ncbi:hypothetical protein D3C72_793030 [compost metagenome]
MAFEHCEGLTLVFVETVSFILSISSPQSLFVPVRYAFIFFSPLTQSFSPPLTHGYVTNKS